MFLVQIFGMGVRKNREVSNCWGIDEESVSKGFQDGLIENSKVKID